MQRRLIRVAKATVIWVVAAFLPFLFFSPGLLALNLFKFDPSFLLVPSLSMVVILFSSNIASIVVEQSSQRKIAIRWLRILALSAFVFLLSKEAVDNALAILPQHYVLLFYVSFPFAGGLLGLSLGSLFGLLGDIRDPMISSVSRWISKGLTRNFVLGFFLTAYFSFARFPIMRRLNLDVAILEWVITTLAIVVIYIDVKASFKERYLDLKNTTWRKHIQEVERETGADFKHLTLVQEQFINHGMKGPLLAYLKQHLRDLGETEQRIMKTTAPLLYYRDKKSSILALPSVKGSLKRMNMGARKKILEDLIAEIEGQMSSL